MEAHRSVQSGASGVNELLNEVTQLTTREAQAKARMSRLQEDAERLATPNEMRRQPASTEDAAVIAPAAGSWLGRLFGRMFRAVRSAFSRKARMAPAAGAVPLGSDYVVPGQGGQDEGGGQPVRSAGVGIEGKTGAATATMAAPAAAEEAGGPMGGEEEEEQEVAPDDRKTPGLTIADVFAEIAALKKELADIRVRLNDVQSAIAQLTKISTYQPGYPQILMEIIRNGAHAETCEVHVFRDAADEAEFGRTRNFHFPASEYSLPAYFNDLVKSDRYGWLSTCASFDEAIENVLHAGLAPDLQERMLERIGSARATHGEVFPPARLAEHAARTADEQAKAPSPEERERMHGEGLTAYISRMATDPKFRDAELSDFDLSANRAEILRRNEELRASSTEAERQKARWEGDFLRAKEEAFLQFKDGPRPDEREHGRRR